MRRDSKFTTGKRMIALSIAVLIIAVLAPNGTLAKEAAAKSGGWQFGASIYGWFPDIEGHTAFSPSDGGGDFEVDIEKILENLEFTLMGIFDLRKGRWGVLTDVIYMDVGGSQTGTRQATIGGSQVPLNAGADVDLDLESWIWTLAGYYRALATPASTLDVLAGTRYLDVEQKVNWNLTGNVAEVPVLDRTGSATADLSNWDFIMGIRGRFAFGAQHSWFIPYYFDLGAGESDFTWQGIAGLGYAFKWCEIKAVWRYLYYDLPSDKPINDMNFSGPAMGLTFRW